MKNRFLGIILSAIMMISCVSAPSVSATGEQALEAFERVCIGIGCISESDYFPDEQITRGEFAKIISNICGLVSEDSASEWRDSVYGETYDQTVSMDNGGNIFDDVDSSHPYFYEIEAVCTKGYMNGTGENRFAPDFAISVMEASKVIADMLGYSGIAQYYGGYTAGYERVFGEVGMLTGIDAGYKDILTQKNALRLFYNVLDEKVVEEAYSLGDVDYSLGELSFMNAVLETYKVSGVLTDNGITSVSGDSVLTPEYIRVNGVSAYLPGELALYRKYIGREVDMYYEYDKDTEESTVRYVEIRQGDESITIDADDFSSYNVNTGVLKYYSDGKLLTKKVSTTANMIYNNRMKTVPYTESDFVIETGDISICKVAGSMYDLIIINDYKTMYVTQKSAAEKKLFNGMISSAQGSVNVITLNADLYNDSMTIADKDGNALTYDDIAVGNILNVLMWDEGVEVIVSKEVVNNFAPTSYTSTYSQTRDEWKRMELSDGERSYDVLKSYYSMSDSVSINFRDSYNLYLDMNGNVAWIEPAAGSGKNYGIITYVLYEDIEQIPYVKIYTTAGKMETLTAAEKYYVNGERKTAANIETDMAQYIGNVVLYSFNSDGLISEFITAAELGDDSNRNRGWHALNESGKSYRYESNGDDFDLMFYYVEGTTKVFTMPNTNARGEYLDADMFSVNATGFTNGEEAAFEAYASSPDAVEAEVIVKKLAVDEMTTSSEVDTYSALLVDNIYRGSNDDNEVVLCIEGYRMRNGSSTPSYTKLTLSSDAKMISFPGRITDDSYGDAIDTSSQTDERDVGPKTPENIQEGDIIRYHTNIKGEVDYIATAYDRVPGSGIADNGTELKGNAYHNGRIYGTTRDVPYADGSTYTGDILTRYGTGIKISMLSSKDPSELSVAEKKRYVKSFRVSNIPVFIVEDNGRGGVNITQGSLDDAIAYDDTLSEYDRVALVGHMTSLLYGAVIYK